MCLLKDLGYYNGKYDLIENMTLQNKAGKKAIDFQSVNGYNKSVAPRRLPHTDT